MGGVNGKEGGTRERGIVKERCMLRRDEKKRRRRRREGMISVHPAGLWR